MKEKNRTNDKMKKFYRMVPLMLLPYSPLIIAKAEPLFIPLQILFHDTDIASYIFLSILGLILIYVIYLPINNTVVTIKGKYSIKDVSEVNFAVKISHVPAYIFNFFLGIISIVLSIWGVGLIAVVIILDVVMIILTGINSIGCIVRMKNEGIISKPIEILFIICSFIFCADILIAIICLVLVKKHVKKEINNLNNIITEQSNIENV